MAESTVCILVPLLGIYVVSLLIFLRLGNIQDLMFMKKASFFRACQVEKMEVKVNA